MHFEVDPGSRRTVKVLRMRPTRHFLYLLVRCRCGKTFGHRADRRTIVCFFCGRTANLKLVRARHDAKPPVVRGSKPAPTKRRVTAPAAQRRSRASR